MEATANIVNYIAKCVCILLLGIESKKFQK